jgi:hypothetical protein
MGSFSWGNPDTTSKITFDAIKEALLAIEWNFFHLSRQILDHLHLEDLAQIQMCIVLDTTIDPITIHDHSRLLHIES